MLEQRPDELRCEVLSGMDEFLDEINGDSSSAFLQISLALYICTVTMQ
jgi:hypothetical protein